MSADLSRGADEIGFTIWAPEVTVFQARSTLDGGAYAKPVPR
jgi:hypothetical protein